MDWLIRKFKGVPLESWDAVYQARNPGKRIWAIPLFPLGKKGGIVLTLSGSYDARRRRDGKYSKEGWR